MDAGAFRDCCHQMGFPMRTGLCLNLTFSVPKHSWESFVNLLDFVVIGTRVAIRSPCYGRSQNPVPMICHKVFFFFDKVTGCSEADVCGHKRDFFLIVWHRNSSRYSRMNVWAPTNYKIKSFPAHLSSPVPRKSPAATSIYFLFFLIRKRTINPFPL